MTVTTPPLIGVLMCQSNQEGQLILTVENLYLAPLYHSGAVAIPLPHHLADDPLYLAAALKSLSGIFLPGSPCNIEPHHYGEEAQESSNDPGRDKLALMLVRHALNTGLPLLGSCRGVHEMVVATGGKLWRQLHNVEGLREHEVNPSGSPEAKFAPVHGLEIAQGGWLDSWVPPGESVRVNTLHQQGIREVGPGVFIEARADDGLIEAISIPEHPFAFGVQWHPEWGALHDEPLSKQMFDAFVAACRVWQAEHQALALTPLA
ncbi:gamma-glutamyl-gamma-aminobutyrate hydrolase family protein [Cronobacter dublinensis]